MSHKVNDFEDECDWLRADLDKAKERIEVLETQVKDLVKQVSELSKRNPYLNMYVVKTPPSKHDGFNTQKFYFEDEGDCWGLLRDEVEDLDVLVGYDQLEALVGKTFTTKDGGLLTVKAV